MVAVAGGELGADDVVAALGRCEGFERLVAEGLATFSDRGRLRLRADVAPSIVATLPEARRAQIALALRNRTLPLEARAFVHLAGGELAAAAQAFEEAVLERRRAGDPEGAAELSGRALALLPEAHAPLLRLARADALRARGRYADARGLLAAASDATSVVHRAEIARLVGDRDAAEADARLAREAADADDEVEALSGALLARLALDAGQLDAAEALLVEASVKAGEGAAAARVAEVSALTALSSGLLAEGRARAERAMRFARAAQDRAGEARALSVMATAELAAGRVHAATHAYAGAFELAESAGELHAAAAFLVNVGLTRLDAGQPGPAIAALREGARRLAWLGRDRDVARALYNLGNGALLVGDDDVARSAVERAREAALRSGDVTAEVFAGVVGAELALRAGDLAGARASVEGAWRASAEAGARARTVAAARGAMVLATTGDLDAASARITAAQEAADEDGSDASVVEHRVAAARLRLARGDATGALDHAQVARVAAERAGTYEARLRASLAVADSAEAGGDRALAAEALSRARSLLDAAAATLDAAGRTRLRAVAIYQRALAATPAERRVEAGDGRWRRLVGYSRRLTAERRVGRLYEEITDAALELSGAERAFLVLRENDGSLRVRAGSGAIPPEQRLDGTGVELSRSIVSRAIDGGQPVSTVDARTDARLGSAASVHALALRSVMAVPLRRGGETFAALYLDDRLRPGAFGSEDVDLLVNLADLASIALEGASLLRADRRAVRRLEVLRRRLARTVESQAVEIATLRRMTTEGGDEVAGIIARSASMREALDLSLRIAASDVPVLVTGESGTGKELVARAIHARSARHGQPFVAENCGAIPEPLLESALFGHVRGAFTGAERARVGLFEAAHGGTLFLDEIGEMSPAMQSKLLRVLQEGEVRPVGSTEMRKVDVRVLSATHRDIEAMVREGTFRHDLFYRLAVVVVQLPPLRERTDDIAPLVAHFVAKHAGKGKPPRLDPRALARLGAFRWPGNVRQLENEVQRALALGADPIGPEHLSHALRDEKGGAPEELDLKGQVDLLERRLIRAALERTDGNQTRAAKLLGVSRYGLQKMIKRLEVG